LKIRWTLFDLKPEISRLRIELNDKELKIQKSEARIKTLETELDNFQANEPLFKLAGAAASAGFGELMR
jgi:hypothetical protein